MTDRELIELAAKAAGIDPAGLEYRLGWWNPLESDADAFRLAVRLGIFLRKDFVALLSLLLGTGMPHDAATRAAVTEIAAKIGSL